MKRLNDWLTRLHKVIADTEGKPFQYGVNDCALFGASIVNACLGFDPAETYRGRYKTKIGGIRAIRKSGYQDQIDYVEKTFSQTPILFSREGDLGLVETEEGPAIVALLGSFAAGVSKTGLIRFPIGEVKIAFRVGE